MYIILRGTIRIEGEDGTEFATLSSETFLEKPRLLAKINEALMQRLLATAALLLFLDLIYLKSFEEALFLEQKSFLISQILWQQD